MFPRPPIRDGLQSAPQNMTRVDAIQFLLWGRRKTAYLEVGVRRGDCFCEVRARRKVAVDPLFQIKPERRREFRNRFCSTYCECTSDEFFERRIHSLPARQFDVIFLDGLHTYAQSHKDVQNSLRHLKEGGWILLHDCNPPNAAAAAPAESYPEAVQRFGLEESKGAWNGEVWKTIVRLRSEEAGLQVAVLDCDEGIGLIRPGIPESRLSLTLDQIEALTYQDLHARRAELLNLKPAAHLFTSRL